MYKKIYKSMCIVSAVTLILTASAIITIFYTIFKNENKKLAEYFIVDGEASVKLFVTATVSALFVCVLIYVLSSIIATYLTENIISPIERTYSFNPEDNKNIYKEIRPFLNRIAIQNRRIKEQMDKIESTDRIRREFSANVSHELKTPITTIHGYAQIINTGIAKQEDIPVFTRKIEKESKRLIALIEDIMELSRLDETTGVATREDIDLFDEAMEVKEELSALSAEKNITFDVKGEKSTVYANKTQISELIFNLCENAVKYNKDNGKVTVEIRNKKITVTDTGIGIPEESLDRIFERFYRVDKSHSKKVNGTGLGLSIVKHIAQVNDAKIEVESILGEGTSFTVTFA